MRTLSDPGFLRDVRRFLEPRWQTWKLERGYLDPSQPLSYGMCRLTAGFLCRALSCEAAFRTGMPEWRQGPGMRPGFYGPGGFAAPPGAPHDGHARDHWRHHSWIEIDGTIVDLAADQFGGALPPVLLADAPDERYAANAAPKVRRAAWLGGAMTPTVDRWLAEAAEADLVPHALVSAPRLSRVDASAERSAKRGTLPENEAPAFTR